MKETLNGLFHHPAFLHSATELFLEALLFLFMLFSLIWVMKKAKSAKKLYIAGTSLHLLSVFWIFFGASSPSSSTAGLCVFFFGTLIMAIALAEEFITDGVRKHAELREEKADRPFKKEKT